jgi:5,10-methylenetetrahydromethanopterin reductase
VLATGPKVIRIAARTAERITFSVGADPDRLRWAIETAKAEMERIGRDPAEVSFGAMAVMMTHRDIEVSRRLASRSVASMARFAIMNKKIVGPVSDSQRDVLERIASVYDMRTHGEGGAHAAVLNDRFIDEFALVGPPDRCLERLEGIRDMGYDRMWLTTPMGQGDLGDESYQLSVAEVVPRLRSA